MSERIPNQFHFVFGLKRQWFPFHLMFYLCLESCIRVNRPERIFFYYRYEPYGRYWNSIKDKLTLVRVEPVAAVKRARYRDRLIYLYRYAHHADFIRLEKLVEHGGIYADMDTLFLNPLPERLLSESFVLGDEGEVLCPNTGRLRASLCNALILARKEAPFGRLWLSRMGAAFDGTWSNHSCFLPQDLSVQHPELIHVEPSRSFYPCKPSREGLRQLFEERGSDLNGAYSVHLWNHLWASRWRHDFSDFHAGQLTEKFIRNVDTTYNVAARRFLAGRSG
jgi:hypothetical protein